MYFWVAALGLFCFCVIEYFIAPFRKVRPYIYPAHGEYATLRAWELRYILVTHESGRIFKRRYGDAYSTEAEAEKAQILRIKKDIELNGMLASLKTEFDARK